MLAQMKIHNNRLILVEQVETQKTKVKFYKDTFGVFAIFPEEIFDNKNNLTCYSHIGQHSAICPDYVKITKCKKATKEEYQDLFNELESLGYNLVVK